MTQLSFRSSIQEMNMAAPFSRAVIAGLDGLLVLGGCSAYDVCYGYGGVSVVYGASRYYDPWYDGYYGWYDGFYYPGSGYYIYDRHGKRHRWSDNHRRHWEGRRHNYHGDRSHEWREGRRDDRREWRQERREDRRDWRADRRADRRDWRESRREQRSEGLQRRQDRSELGHRDRSGRGRHQRDR